MDRDYHAALQCHYPWIADKAVHHTYIERTYILGMHDLNIFLTMHIAG